MTASAQFSSQFQPQYESLKIDFMPTLGASRQGKLYPCLLKEQDSQSKYSDWESVVEQSKKMDEKALWNLRPPRFCLDMYRQNVFINNLAYNLGDLSAQKKPDLLLDSQIITLLSMHYFPCENPAEVSRQRAIHLLRYQIQDVMHQWIYKIDQEFIERYLNSYVEADRLVVGAPEGAISLNISDERIEIVATQRLKVVKLLNIQEVCGYESQRVIISILKKDLDQVQLFLSQTQSPQVNISFHGMVETAEELLY
jgi:hypothetical protein